MVTRWFDGKKAAVSFSFEGNHEGLYNIAAPLLKEKKWRGTFFISTKTANWDRISSAHKSGHEIGNHSHSNRNLISLNLSEVNQELLTSTQLIHKNIPNCKVMSFSYPFGKGISPGLKLDSIRSVVSKYHIAATSPGTSGGYLTIQNSIPYRGYQNNDFHNYYYQLGTYVVKSSLSLEDYNKELDLVIDSGDWLSLMYYSIGATGREYIPEDKFQTMLSTVELQDEYLWVASFGEIAMYHQMRRNARIEYLQVEKGSWTMYLEDDLDDEIYNMPLTVQVMKPIDCDAIRITQNGEKIQFHQDWRTLQFNAVPDKGPIHINYKEVKVD